MANEQTTPTPMTVSELIAKLRQYDGDLPVFFECEDHYYNGPVLQDDFEEGEAYLIESLSNDPDFWSLLEDWFDKDRIAKTIKCLKLIVNSEYRK